MTRIAPLLAAATLAMAGCQKDPPPVDLGPATLEVKGPGLHKIQVQARTETVVKYAVYVPADLPKDGKVPLVVVLHGAGKDQDWFGAGLIEALYKEGTKPLGAVVIAPDSLTGDDWNNTMNVDHVVWLTRAVVNSYPIDEKKVVLSGFSVGGVGTWFTAPRADGLFTAAIPVAGEPKTGGADWTLPVCAVHAEKDTVRPPAATKNEIEKLQAAGKKANFILLKDGTAQDQADRYVRPLQEACAWVKANW